MNNTNVDLPITALCIVTEKNKCPSNYVAITKSHDFNVDTDLWKDGLFGKKINRFICFTKDYPINDQYNVIEDIKLLNVGDNLIGGFIPVDKCFDNNSEKSFQKKVLCIKVAHRFYTPTAVSDIIILVRSKRPPIGYTFIGEINNHTICVKFSPATKQQTTIPSSMSTNNLPTPSSLYPQQLQAPPVPPRPNSIANLSVASLEQTYVHIDSNSTNNDYSNTIRSYQTQNSHTTYNPLQGVPFEINPIYNAYKAKENGLDLNELNQCLMKSNLLLTKMSYDYNLEKTCLRTNEL